MRHVARSRRARVAATFLASGLALTAFSAFPAAAAPDDAPEPTRSFQSEGNPIISDGSRYTADAATLVVDDTLYIYAGRDEAGPQFGSFNMKEYDILATTDVAGGDWDHYQGALSPGDVFDWATGNAAYAGGVTEGPDGKYYWYAPVETKSTQYANRMAIGVAVSDSPVGPWEDAVGEPIVDWGDVFGNSNNGQEVIDPHVLVDGDRVYLYWGSWYIGRVVELEPDMVTLKGEIIEMDGLDSFFEAPWVTKRGGEYHMLYDWKKAGSECTPSNYQACIGYATSDSPTGPWEFEGIVLGETSSTTVHPSLIEFNDKWYMTYHTKDAKDGGHFRRSVAIDEVQWDGNRIQRVQPTRADDPAWRLTTNIAPDATPSASYTETPPMRIGALNDGRVTTAMLPPDQWGNYRGEAETAESDWVMYEWDQPAYVSSMGIEFHRDGGWIRQPADWDLEYRDPNGEWQDLPTDTTPTATGAWHDVDFAPVTTDALRLRLYGTPNGNDHHAVSISEWEVHSAPISDLDIPEIYVDVDEKPRLPLTITATYADGTEGRIAVKWRDYDEQLLQSPGEFVVTGRALGVTDGYVELPVIVGGDKPDPVEDTEAPTVSLLASGSEGSDGWFSSDVNLRLRAIDNVDEFFDFSLQIDDADPVTASDVPFFDYALDSEGIHEVTGTASDAAGNAGTVEHVIKIDKTKPTVAAELDDRAVVLSASDELSGIAEVAGAFSGEAFSDVDLETPIAAPSDQPNTFRYRVTDTAGNTSQGTVSIPLADGAVFEGNLAPLAEPSASYTAPWETVAGLNDGSADLFENDSARLAKDWGAWPRAGEQWAALTWDSEITTDSIGVWWYRDTPDAANGGVIPPKSWVLEYRADSEWVEVELLDGEYGRSADKFEVITFEPVTTEALRIRAQSWGEDEGEGSVGIREWQVAAATDSGVDPSDPELDVTLQAGVRCTASKVFVTGLLTNASDADVDVVLHSDFATKSLQIAPGKNGFHAFTTRLAEAPAGEIAAEISAEIDGETVTIDLNDSYEQLSCN